MVPRTHGMGATRSWESEHPRQPDGSVRPRELERVPQAARAVPIVRGVGLRRGRRVRVRRPARVIFHAIRAPSEGPRTVTPDHAVPELTAQGPYDRRPPGAAPQVTEGLRARDRHSRSRQYLVQWISGTNRLHASGRGACLLWNWYRHISD